MYTPFTVKVTGEPSRDLESSGREEAFMQMGGRSLVLLGRDNRTLLQEGETFTEATFTFMEVPA